MPRGQYVRKPKEVIEINNKVEEFPTITASSGFNTYYTSGTNNQLVDLISTLAQSVQKLSDEVKELKQKQDEAKIASQPMVMSPIPIVPQPSVKSSFFSMVPSELLAVAKEVLGEKFQFECIPATDKPFFDFVVIVPPEYSTETSMQDRRSRMIPNSDGVDEVRKWCKLVKENVIRKLGKELPVNV